MSVSDNKILPDHSHTHMFTYCLWLLPLYNCIVELLEKETVWPTKPKILIIGPLENSLQTLALHS